MPVDDVGTPGRLEFCIWGGGEETKVEEYQMSRSGKQRKKECKHKVATIPHLYARAEERQN